MAADPEAWNRHPLSEKANAPSPGTSAPEDPAAAYLAQLGPGSQRTMREALGKLAGWASNGKEDLHTYAWHTMDIEHTTALRTRLISTVAPATANKNLAALRGVLKQCWQQRRMTAESYQSAIALPPVSRESPRKTNPLGSSEIQKLARACTGDPSPAGARDEALLGLLFSANLRRSEAVGLDIANYDLATGELRIQGLGPQPERRVPLPNGTRRVLDRWILVRGTRPGPLFNPINKGGRIEHRRLSEQAIYIACRKRAAEAGLPPTSPEDLRRADGSNWTRPSVASLPSAP